MSTPLTFEEWQQTHQGEMRDFFRHAAALEPPRQMVDWQWRLVYRHMANRVIEWVLRLTESQRLRWEHESITPFSQMQDFEFQVGVGMKVDVARRPSSDDEYAPYLLYLVQLLEQDAIAHQQVVSSLQAEVDQAIKKLSALGWVVCDICLEWVRSPHDPCPRASMDD